jgi:hypothetical protein
MKRGLIFLVAAVIAASVGFLAPGPAVAAPGQSTACSGDLVVKLDPGLTFVTQRQRLLFQGTLSNCAGGGVTGGTVVGKGRAKASCTEGIVQALFRVRWDTGETSSIYVQGTLSLSGGSLTGTVTAGKFVGESVTASNISVTVLTGNCFTPVTKAELTADVGI